MTSGVGSSIPIRSRRRTRSGSPAVPSSASGSDSPARARAAFSAMSADIPAARATSYAGLPDWAHRPPTPVNSTIVEHRAGRWRRSSVRKSSADRGVMARRASAGNGPAMSTKTRSIGTLTSGVPTGPLAGRPGSAGGGQRLDILAEDGVASAVREPLEPLPTLYPLGCGDQCHRQIGWAVEDHRLCDQTGADPKRGRVRPDDARPRAGFQSDGDRHEREVRAFLDHCCDLGRGRSDHSGLGRGRPATRAETNGDGEEVFVAAPALPYRWPAGDSPLHDLGRIRMQRPDPICLGGSGRAKLHPQAVEIGLESCRLCRSPAPMPGPVFCPLGKKHQRPDHREQRHHRVEEGRHDTAHGDRGEQGCPTDPWSW